MPTSEPSPHSRPQLPHLPVCLSCCLPKACQSCTAVVKPPRTGGAASRDPPIDQEAEVHLARGIRQANLEISNLTPAWMESLMNGGYPRKHSINESPKQVQAAKQRPTEHAVD